MSLNTTKHLRLILIILLILTAAFGLAILGAGSHGNISMKNKETASLLYGAISISIAVIVNVISIRKRFSVLIGFLSFTFNLISAIVLTYALLFLIEFNQDGGRFPILFIVVIGIEILLSAIISVTDLIAMNKLRLQQQR